MASSQSQKDDFFAHLDGLDDDIKVEEVSPPPRKRRKVKNVGSIKFATKDPTAATDLDTSPNRYLSECAPAFSCKTTNEHSLRNELASKRRLRSSEVTTSNNVANTSTFVTNQVNSRLFNGLVFCE